MAKKNPLYWTKVSGKYMTTTSDRNLNANLIFYNSFLEVKARAKRESRSLKAL